MPRVPITGEYVTSGEDNGIKECVILGGGSPASDDMEALVSASSFELFDPTFLNGATDISGIDSTNQFRGYPVLGGMALVMFSVPGDMSFPPNTEEIEAFVDFYLVSDDSLIGTASIKDSNITATRTFVTLGGFTGEDTLACFYGFNLGAVGSNCGCYFTPNSIVSTYGEFYIKVRALYTGATATISSTFLVNPTFYNANFKNINYGATGTFKSTTPDTLEGAQFNEDTGFLLLPSRHSRSWSGTLITDLLPEFFT